MPEYITLLFFMNIVTPSRLDISQPPRRRVLSPDTAPCSGSSPSPPHEASGIKSNPQINGNNLQIIVFIIDCQLPSDPQRRLLLLYKKSAGIYISRHPASEASRIAFFCRMATKKPTLVYAKTTYSRDSVLESLTIV